MQEIWLPQKYQTTYHPLVDPHENSAMPTFESWDLRLSPIDRCFKPLSFGADRRSQLARIAVARFFTPYQRSLTGGIWLILMVSHLIGSSVQPETLQDDRCFQWLSIPPIGISIGEVFESSVLGGPTPSPPWVTPAHSEAWRIEIKYY